MTDIQLEQALANYFAAILELEVDTTIFRGKIPAKKENCCAVLLNSASAGNIPALARIDAQVLGKYTERDNCLTRLEALRKALPAYAVESADKNDTPVTFKALLKRGSGGWWTADDNGKDTYCFSFNFTVVFPE